MLEGRLSHPLTSRAEGLRQFQTTMPLSASAQKELKQSSAASLPGPKRTGNYGKGSKPYFQNLPLTPIDIFSVPHALDCHDPGVREHLVNDSVIPKSNAIGMLSPCQLF